MTRSSWKGPFCEQTLNKTNSSDSKSKTPTRFLVRNKVWSRRSTILPIFLNKQLLIYNGKVFIPLTVTEEMIGHKYGEFAGTRKKPIHKKKRK